MGDINNREQVKVKISSQHDYGFGEKIPIEVISTGEMFTDDDGNDCVLYEEVVDSDDSGQMRVINNFLRIGDTQVELIKDGDLASHMVFVPNHKTVSYLPSPIGEVEIGVHTALAEKTQYTNGFVLKLEYDLELNQTMISNCGLSISVMNK